MSLLQLVVWLLTAATALAAASYAERRHRNRPVAWYLLALLVLDALRLYLIWRLPDDREIRSGLDLWLRHASQAAYLGAIIALPAMSVALFFRHRPWLVWLVGFGIWAVLTGSYPAIRGVELLWVYSGLQLGAGLISVGLLLTWVLLCDERITVPICSGGFLITGSLATSILPELVGARTLQNWSANVGLQGFTLAIVLVLQLWALTADRAPKRSGYG